MNKRVINSVITKKFNAWVTTIEDSKVADAVRNNTFITGGCIPSLLLGEDVNDYDVYFKNYDTALAVAEYYVEQFNKHRPRTVASIKTQDDRIQIFISSEGVAKEDGYNEQEEDEVSDATTDSIPEDSDKGSYRPVYLSENAVTLSDGIQLIIRFFGDIDEIHSNFDFIHATSYWDSYTNKLVLRKDALESLMTKELRYGGSKYPLASIIRTRKFIKRGWSIHAGTYLVMIMQLNELDLQDVEVLKDQLTGVDSAYFSAILSNLPDEQVNASYIASIVDKLFN